MTPPESALRRGAPDDTTAFNWDEFGRLLDLAAPALDELRAGRAMTCPAGLRCSVRRRGDGLQLVLLLGVDAEALPGAAVPTLLRLQALYLEANRWWLGMDEQGELQLSALQPAASARELAALFCEGHVAAWSAGRALLQPEHLAAEKA